jgi:hypothetical protein
MRSSAGEGDHKVRRRRSGRAVAICTDPDHGPLGFAWQLIRPAVRGADSDDTSRIAATPYAIAVTITLADIERMVGELQADLKGGRRLAVTTLLNCIHDAVRSMRSEVDLAADSPWGRQLAAIRSEVSSALGRRSNRPPAAFAACCDRGPPARSRPPRAWIQAKSRIPRRRSHCWGRAVTRASSRSARHLIPSCSNISIRIPWSSGETPDRPFRQSQVEAAVPFCAKLFGPQYAALLGKAAEVATNSDRKAAVNA